ncbi:thioredoxin [Myxococcota bacterium]|nr:thioredoxin [Myxococcota bacterium]
MSKPHVYDISEAEFQSRVMERSLEVPVLVDFWAPWCAPCKQLGPVLEKLAAEYAGRFELVKVNTEEAQQLATMLRIRSIPTVYLFMDGQPIDGFQGVQPEAKIRALLEQHIPEGEKGPMALGLECLDAGDQQGAAAYFQDALRAEPKNGEALMHMARIALNMGEREAASRYASLVESHDPLYGAAQRFKQTLSFADDAGDEAALRAQIEANSKDVEAWYRLGATLAVGGRFNEAAEAFIKVVALDRGFREDAGREAALSLFDMMDQADPATRRLRRRLAMYVLG